MLGLRLGAGHGMLGVHCPWPRCHIIGSSFAFARWSLAGARIQSSTCRVLAAQEGEGAPDGAAPNSLGRPPAGTQTETRRCDVEGKGERRRRGGAEQVSVALADRPPRAQPHQSRQPPAQGPGRQRAARSLRQVLPGEPGAAPKPRAHAGRVVRERVAARLQHPQPELGG
eukprot:29352-Rhodomonas_salina.6